MGGTTGLRVAQVVPYSWSVPGGVKSHVVGLTRALRSRGLEVDVIAPADGPTTFPGVLAVGESFPIHDNGSLVPVALGPRAAHRTSQLLHGGGYDLVHVHEPMIPVVSLTALWRARVPLVGTFHMYSAGPRWYRPFAPLCRRSLARLDARIAVSDAARRHVAATCPGDYSIIPNGIDVETFSTRRPSPDGPRVLFIGRVEPRKGLPVLLRAFTLLAPDVRLDLAGVRPDEVRRTKVALTADQRARIDGHGYVSGDERARLLASADVLCVPSLQGESFGMVLLEGMAAGAAVVASAVVGYRDVLREGCGMLVPPGDSEALGRAIGELISDRQLRDRLVANARREVRRYDWSEVASQVLALYEAVLAEPPAEPRG